MVINGNKSNKSAQIFFKLKKMLNLTKSKKLKNYLKLFKSKKMISEILVNSTMVTNACNIKNQTFEARIVFICLRQIFTKALMP